MTQTSAVLLAAEPQLFVTDLERARAFYVEGLGFEVAVAYGEPPFYMQVRRDGAALNLRRLDAMPAGSEEEPDLLAATLTVDDARKLYSEFEGRDLAFHQPLRQEPWGAWTFMVADPDGNLLCFAG
jgi:catechol 2,3-dioxygenase-like lactoylglutathione lyase family enzyme